MTDRINVTKTFLPPLEEYEAYLEKIWESGQLTNQGPLLLRFQDKAKEFLGVKNFHFVTNGTLALQLAIRALDIQGADIITTPFSYVASVSSILWERSRPVFVDIEADTFCIDANKIEAAITPSTKAILAVHVFGNPCDTAAIESIAAKHNLKVIYDAAHAFGVEYEGKSLLAYGDISCCSFHATKLFHTIEGGAVITNDSKISENLELSKRFGHEGDEHFMLGINAKASELQAAMGLCNLNHLEQIIKDRQRVASTYSAALSGKVQTQRIRQNTKYNYAYFPIVMESEERLNEVVEKMNRENIFPRRYFYPSLNTLRYIKDAGSCQISEDIANRIICLPMYVGLKEQQILKIAGLVGV